MSSLIKKIKQFFPEIYFSILTLAILYKSIGVGYILSLDLIFAPNMHHVANPYYPDPTNGFINRIIEQIVKIVPAYALEQIILITIVFAIGYNFYKLLIHINKGQKLPSIIAATFYLWNPFVYSRIMAGQWQFLAAYSLFPLFIHLILNTDFTKIKDKNIIYIISVWVVTTLFSIHFSVIFSIAFTLILLVNLFQRKQKKLIFKNTVQTILLFSLIISPILFNIFSTIQTHQFTEQDNLFFSSLPDQTFGIYFNLISMFGFWAENTIMISPKAVNQLWYMTFIVFLISIVIYLICKFIKKSYTSKEKKVLPIAILFITVGLLLLFTNINTNNVLWNLFYTKFPILQPFREAQKLSSMYIFGFLLIFNFALVEIVRLVRSKRFELFILLIILANIFVYTPTLFGLNNQLIVKQYPKSYYEAQRLIEINKTYKILILPWRAYDFYTFSNRQIANPAYIFFGEQALSQQNLYDIQNPLTQEYFKQNSIKYILLNKSSGYKDIQLQLQKSTIHKQSEDANTVIYNVD